MTETPTTDTGGVLLVDKPAGITSHDVVAIVRRATKVKRVGHAGTLDPFATGLLVVLVGRGTRLIPFIEGEPKVYDATIRFGAETETDDNTGDVTRVAEPPSETQIRGAIPALTGTISQVPPAYSAKQIGGTRAYAAARAGTPLELAAVVVNVHDWKVVSWNGTELTARITCGGGTYIRALARDLGRAVHSAAHLAALRRTASGPFTVDQATPLGDIEARRFALRDLRDAVPSMATQSLDDAELRRVSHGNSVENRTASSRVALLDGTALVAVADAEGSTLHPRLVLRDA